jgi:hypothetical protein
MEKCRRTRVVLAQPCTNGSLASARTRAPKRSLASAGFESSSQRLSAELATIQKCALPS